MPVDPNEPRAPREYTPAFDAGDMPEAIPAEPPEPEPAHNPFNLDPIEELERKLMRAFEQLEERVKRCEFEAMTPDERMRVMEFEAFVSAGFTPQQARLLSRQTERTDMRVERLERRFCEAGAEASSPFKVWGPYVAAIAPHIADLLGEMLGKRHRPVKRHQPVPTWYQRIFQQLLGL
jgi:hypothetical protein